MIRAVDDRSRVLCRGRTSDRPVEGSSNGGLPDLKISPFTAPAAADVGAPTFSLATGCAHDFESKGRRENEQELQSREVLKGFSQVRRPHAEACRTPLRNRLRGDPRRHASSSHRRTQEHLRKAIRRREPYGWRDGRNLWRAAPPRPPGFGDWLPSKRTSRMK